MLPLAELLATVPLPVALPGEPVMPELAFLPHHHLIVVVRTMLDQDGGGLHRGSETLTLMPLPVASNEGEPVMAQLIALTGDDLVVLVRTEVRLEQCGSRPDSGAKRLAAVPLPVPAPRKPIMAEALPLT